MNFIHMKCVIEVARAGSINKASESLLMAPPNLSREIKELEAELGTHLFIRTAHGMKLTPAGEEFVGYAKKIISQVDDIKNAFSGNRKKKLRFSISVPRATYISEAFAQFSKCITGESAEVFYHETNASGAVQNILESDYKLGIVRYAEHHDKYFKNMFEEKGLAYELIAEFQYVLAMSVNSPLAGRENIRLEDLCSLTEIAHADAFVPSLPLSSTKKDALSGGVGKHIYVFERGSQFDLLCKNPLTFMWVSPLPDDTLARYELVQKACSDDQRTYKDVLIHRENYSLSKLDRQFITELCQAKRKYVTMTEKMKA